MDGILIINKEKGWTSNDVVRVLKRILHMKKIGHTGTLDPFATGVLPVVLGKGTGLSEFLMEKKKTYRVVMRLGVTTDTQDMTGTILKEQSQAVTLEEFQAAALSFLGDRMQIPPMYSALKQDGKRLYELAREGIVVERPPRPVTFHRIEVLDFAGDRAALLVTCSRGTYIRTLCHDIGEKLGCGAAAEELVRTASGMFTLEESHTIEEVEKAALEGKAENLICPVEQVFHDYPRILCIPEGDRLLRNGNPLVSAFLTSGYREGHFRLCTSDGTFAGIYEWVEKKEKYYPVKMFL